MSLSLKAANQTAACPQLPVSQASLWPTRADTGRHFCQALGSHPATRGQHRPRAGTATLNKRKGATGRMSSCWTVDRECRCPMMSFDLDRWRAAAHTKKKQKQTPPSPCLSTLVWRPVLCAFLQLQSEIHSSSLNYTHSDTPRSSFSCSAQLILLFFFLHFKVAAVGRKEV